LTYSELGKIGGKISGQKMRQKSLEEYYLNPNKCINCGKIIKVLDRQKVSIVRRKKFCNHSCAATYNNQKYPKRIAENERITFCDKCGKKIKQIKRSNGTFSSRKTCNECNKALAGITKGELWEKSNRRSTASSRVTSHARKTYIDSGKELKCKICGYDKHIEVCHIKAISEFNMDALIVEEINNVNNLIALCPNHHWEFDNNILKL